MQVDFYHLTRDPADRLVPMLAEKSLKADERVLLVSQNEVLCSKVSKALWKNDAQSFLAHDFAGSERETSQPILISDQCIASNDARFIILADGKWRDDALNFERAFFLFSAEDIDGARNAWRDLSAKQDVAPRYWKQDGGRWVEGP